MKNKIWKWLLNNWIKFAEIAVVIWAINGMWQEIKPGLLLELPFSSRGPGWLSVLFYFLSVILILYLLRRYETRNPQICR